MSLRKLKPALGFRQWVMQCLVGGPCFDLGSFLSSLFKLLGYIKEPTNLVVGSLVTSRRLNLLGYIKEPTSRTFHTVCGKFLVTSTVDKCLAAGMPASLKSAVVTPIL